MSIEKIISELKSIKELDVDQRIDFMDQIEEIEEMIITARDILSDIPDITPEDGVADPRLAFVEKLIEESDQGNSRKVKVK